MVPDELSNPYIFNMSKLCLSSQGNTCLYTFILCLYKCLAQSAKGVP